MVDIEEIFSTTKVLVIAEVGINHNGNFDRLIKLVESAKEAGADAVKFQIFSEKLFFIDTVYLPKEITEKIPIDIFRRAFIPFDKYSEVFDYSKSIGILPFATPLDLESFNFLEGLQTNVFKIASSDISYVPLLKKVSRTKKIVIISTGFSTIKEIKKYLKLIKNNPTIVMFCVSRYPSYPNDISIKEFVKFRKTFESIKSKKRVGFSDHTKTLSLPVAMAALGAKAIEKHLTLDENDDSPDNAVSISPSKFKTMVEMIREIEESLSCEARNLPDDFTRKMSMRSFVPREHIKKYQRISEDHIEALRPSIFLSSSIENWKKIVNKKSQKDYMPREPFF
ncbi:MAG: N-acetylneuraminate synthase family protein [Brevinematia bacterium]